MNEFDSRFFTNNDPMTDEIVYKFPKSWWSRLYEYEWAKLFPKPNDVVLDAACGIVHPFKFYLTSVAKEVHACDINPEIGSPHIVIEALRSSWFGTHAADLVQQNHINKVQLRQANLTQLPYETGKFDKIFCISVLEEMPVEDRIRALQEFHRVLKDDGLLIVTFDYPVIDLQQLQQNIRVANLTFAGQVNFELPHNAVYTDLFGGLYCFRSVLKKNPG